jgi:PEP-CTERM motif
MTRRNVVPTLDAPALKHQTLGRFHGASSESRANSGRTWGGEALISSNGEQQLAYGTDPVPEPTTLALLTGGLIGLSVVRRRKRSA